MKRRLILTITLTLLTVTAICQAACSSCHSKWQPVSVNLVLEGEIGNECNFGTMAANGQQVIDILVTDNTDFARYYQVYNVPGLTYPIEVPSKGPWQINVKAVEKDNKTCPLCPSTCPGQKQGHPTWETTKTFPTGGVTGTYNVVLVFPGTSHPGGVPCPC